MSDRVLTRPVDTTTAVAMRSLGYSSLARITEAPMDGCLAKSSARGTMGSATRAVTYESQY
jgi:hypothetical protein